MESKKEWPKIGDRLVHRYRKKRGEVMAEVLAVDREAGRISVRVGKKEFPSLSAAALAIQGSAANGWIYWGLKKQHPKTPRR